MNFIENVKKKINENIKPENLSVIDNSHLHKKHKFFNVNKFHLKIIIKSKKLKNMHKIKAHKEIYEALKDEMKNRIHALEIEIE